MKLYITPTSPYARKARVVVAEKNLPCEELATAPWDDAPEVVENSPLRRIPILITDDGMTLVESRVICEYLDSLSDSPRLLPADASARLRVQTRAAIAEGAIDSALAIVMANKVAPGMASEEWTKWLMNKVGGALKYFENDLQADTFDMADVTLGALIGSLDFRMPEYDWKNLYPKVAAHWQALSARPSFAGTAPSA